MSALSSSPLYYGGPGLVPSALTSTPSVLSGTTNASVLPPEEPNSKFKPTTTAVIKNPKLKLHVLLDSTIYTAGGTVYGRLVVTSSTSRSLRIGDISVELTAYEELTTREVTASQSFLSSRLVFQSGNLPPSNAVHGPREGGFWMAKKGKTTFPFAFKIPVDAPSSVQFGNSAALRYVVTGVTQVLYNGKEDTIFKSKEAFVVEAWDAFNPIYKQPIEQDNMKQLWMGGTGALMLEGTLVETLFMSGGNVSVQVRVKNDTRRRVQGLKLAIKRRLLVLSNKRKKEADDVKVLSETMAEEWFKNKDYLFECGEDRTTTVNIHVPPTVRTIRNTALFEVTCHIVISVYLGPFTKDLIVDLPGYICHSASLQPPPVANLELNQYANHYNMMDENADFFVEDVRQDDSEVLGALSQPVNIPGTTRKLPWSNEDDDPKGRYSPSSAKSSAFGSASPKKIGSLASSLLSRPKQMSPSSPSKLIPKSPPLGPASPYAYIPAIERVRYLSFATQQQTALGKRPLVPPGNSNASGFGMHSPEQQWSPPPSEYEFIPSPVSSSITQWLSNQEDVAYDSRPGSPDRASDVTQVTVDRPNANQGQEMNAAGMHPEQRGLPIPSQENHWGQDAFQRSNSPVASPPGPSGLTLLMKQKAASPALPEEFVDQTSSSNYDHIPKGRPLPIPQSNEPMIVVAREQPSAEAVPGEAKAAERPKNRYLQVPGMPDNNGEDLPPANDSSSNSSGLGALLRWGGSWIGYSSSKPSDSETEDAPLAAGESAENHKVVDTDKSLTPALEEGLENSGQANSPTDKEAFTTAVSGIIKPTTPPKPHVPPKPTVPINKASIFAALGRKPLGGGSPPESSGQPARASSPILKSALRSNSPSPPSSPPASRSSSPPLGASPPKFQVPRKPVAKNKHFNEAVAGNQSNAVSDSIAQQDSSTDQGTDRAGVESGSPSMNADEKLIPRPNRPPPPTPATKPWPFGNSPPRNSVTAQSKVSGNAPVAPTVSTNSPPGKIIGAPTTYVNTTIARPVVVGADGSAAVVSSERYKRPLPRPNVPLPPVPDNKESVVQDRIDVPLDSIVADEPVVMDAAMDDREGEVGQRAKPPLGPRLQEYINKYNLATAAIDVGGAAISRGGVLRKK